MATSSGIVLHQYKTTFVLWLMPLFAVIGCLLVGLSVGLPYLLKPALDPGMWISIGIAFLAGLAMPIGALLMWLLIPAVNTTYYPDRRALALEYLRPFRRTIKEYRMADIADIGLVSVGTRTFALALYLKNGKRVRIEYSGSSDKGALYAQAERIRAAIGVGPTATIPI